MDVEIVPTVFALEKEVFESKLEKLGFAKKLHIDFMDGKFVSSKSVEIEDMESLQVLGDKLLEIHLMAYTPQINIPFLRSFGVKGVFIQYEAFRDDVSFEVALDEFLSKGFYVYCVLNPTTHVEVVYKYAQKLEGVMLMSVWPGKEGQEFIEDTYGRIRKLRKKFPALNIAVDGGIKDTNARKLVEVGANRLCVGSFISSAQKPKVEYEKLLRLIFSLR